MNNSSSSYIHDLEAIVACDQSDGYLKRWAEERLEEIRYDIKFISPSAKTLVAA